MSRREPNSSRSARTARGGAVAAILLALVGLAWGCDRRSAGGPQALAGRAAGWNVLLLTLDTVRADRVGAWGYTRRQVSPAIDALVAGGVRFEQAMAPRAITWPSLASALTGLYPSGHGVIQNGYDFPPDVPTLATLLQGAGYQTGAFLSNMCKAAHRGLDVRYCSKSIDGRTTREALRWAESLDRERPFFLWAHYFAAHPPYSNGRDLAARRLDPGYRGPLRPKGWALDRVMTEPIPLGPRDLVHLDALYDAAMIRTDQTVGDLLRGLEQEGLLERTLVVLLSDHGEDLYEHHGYLYHACSVYQTGLHVPLALVAPGLLPAGVSVPQAVELIDVAPTLLELLGIPPLAEAHGVSLLPYLERPGGSDQGRPAFSEFDRTRIRTVLVGDWKLVDNPDGFTPLCFEGAPPDLYPIAEAELYNLAEDPAESRNLAAAEPDKVAALRQLIAARFAGLRRRDAEQLLPEELKEELRALGYVAE